jgi:DNA invertase Pin-like site-specific DNA recombinase
MMGAFAQFERANIADRRAEGMAIAMKDRTKYIGKQSKLTKEQEQEILKLWNTDLSKTAIGAQFGLTRSGIYKTYSRISKK